MLWQGFYTLFKVETYYCSTIRVSKRGQSCMVQILVGSRASVGADRAPGRMRPGVGMFQTWLFLLLATSSSLTSSKIKWVMCFFGSRSFKMQWRTARIGEALLPYLCFWCAANDVHCLEIVSCAGQTEEEREEKSWQKDHGKNSVQNSLCKMCHDRKSILNYTMWCILYFPSFIVMSKHTLT